MWAAEKKIYDCKVTDFYPKYSGLTCVKGENTFSNGLLVPTTPELLKERFEEASWNFDYYEKNNLVEESLPFFKEKALKRGYDDLIVRYHNKKAQIREENNSLVIYKQITPTQKWYEKFLKFYFVRAKHTPS